MWGIAVPARSSRLPGVRMAGFVGDTVDEIDLTVVPYPAVTVFLNLREKLHVNEVTRGSVVAGLAPRGMRVRGLGIECMQIRLSPEVAHAVLGTDLGGEVASLEDVWSTDLPSRLRAVNSWHDRFALVEAVLGQRYEAGRTVDPEVAFAWQRMSARHGQVRIEQLADETGWSRKRLWARFRGQLGLSPKRAAQLVRFDHAVHQLVAGQAPATVAAESGYVDQAHLHHEVKAFAGLTPLRGGDRALAGSGRGGLAPSRESRRRRLHARCGLETYRAPALASRAGEPVRETLRFEQLNLILTAFVAFGFLGPKHPARQRHNVESTVDSTAARACRAPSEVPSAVPGTALTATVTARPSSVTPVRVS